MNWWMCTTTPGRVLYTKAVFVGLGSKGSLSTVFSFTSLTGCVHDQCKTVQRAMVLLL
jgi:hypothetical protein